MKNFKLKFFRPALMKRFLSHIRRKNLNTRELNEEKNKDYRNIVYLQMLIILSAMLLKETLAISGVNIKTSKMVGDILFLTLGGLYVFVLWDILRNLTKSNTLIIGMFVLMMVGLGVAFFAVNPVYEFFENENSKRPYLFLIHSSLFIIESTVIYHCLYDIFTGKKLSAEKIWGAACIYLMIGISFGSVFDLINIVNPGSMGIPLSQGLESYMVCIYYSMTIIGGHDAFLQAIPLIQNLGIIEAVWSNLFVVLLVGRLLGKPDDEVIIEDKK